MAAIHPKLLPQIYLSLVRLSGWGLASRILWRAEGKLIRVNGKILSKTNV
jgi:hypothetical protein